MSWETIIGLEVHAQLATRSKIWCGCSTDFGAPPNTQTCPVCLGMPGSLPVLNERVVEFAVKAGLALGCEIHERSVFARKNYFYPDLPKGYQISQFELPICGPGTLEIGAGAKAKTVGVTRIHIEEDAAKNLHGLGGEAVSVVDYNRGGTPLVEIVSEPDLRSSDEAVEYYKALRAIVVALGINDGNMEEGNLRCDANVSVRRPGEPFRKRVELKNLNSFRFLKAAIEFEVRRQIQAYENDEPVVQETRLYDNAKGETRSLRSKEAANDYRYFPEPDLLPLATPPAFVDAIRARMPELPKAKAKRLSEAHGVAFADAVTITAEPALAAYFETCLPAYPDGKRLGNWFVGELARVLNEGLTTLETLKFGPAELAALLRLVDAGTISNNAAKEVFAALVEQGGDPAKIVEARGLAQVSDAGAIEAAADRVVAANPGEVEKYRAGKKSVIGFFVGQVMKEMKGKGNPGLVNEVLRKKLEG